MLFTQSMHWALKDGRSERVDRIVLNILEIYEVQLAL